MADIFRLSVSCSPSTFKRGLRAQIMSSSQIGKPSVFLRRRQRYNQQATGEGAFFEGTCISFKFQLNHSSDQLEFSTKWCASYLEQYMRRLNTQVLDEAVHFGELAVRSETADGMPENFLNLAAALTERYKISAALNDLENALKYVEHGLQLPNIPCDGQYHEKLTQISATLFLFRYQRRGDPNDLENSISRSEMALKTNSDSSQDLHNLGLSLMERYWREGREEDLKDALHYNRRAVSQTAPGDPEFPHRIQNLGSCLRDYDRYLKATTVDGKEKKLGGFNNFCVNEILQRDQEVLRLNPQDRAGCIQNLALSFKDLHDNTGKMKYLNKALNNIRYAVSNTHPGHPLFRHRLHIWAEFLAAKYEASNHKTYLKQACLKYKESFDVQENVANDLHFIWSWRAALKWVLLEKKQGSAESCIEAYSIAFNLLPHIIWIGNPLHVRQAACRDIDITNTISDGIAACLAQNNLKDAIVLADKALTVILQQQCNLTAYFHKHLCQTDPDPDALKILSLHLLYGRHPHPYEIVKEREELLSKIQKQRGFEKFLCSRSYDDLLQVSKDGPVVILNANISSCDAIVLHSSSRIFAIKLEIDQEDLKKQKVHLERPLGHHSSRRRLSGDQEEIPSQTTNFKDLRGWLDKNIVKPIYDYLESCGISEGRFWWCPTGNFVGLPLHAAGTSDKFIQSYIPSLGLLLNARQRGSPQELKVGLVGVQQSNCGGTKLPRVNEEVEEIARIISASDDQLQVNKLLGPSSNFENVCDLLQRSTWMHFACHGRQSMADPSKSCLKLHDCHLDMETIVQMDLPNPEFVFLAACHTARGDSTLVNESLHLSGGFIAAGFKAAIGTLWAMGDEDGPDLSQAVYRHLFDKTRLQKLNKSCPTATDTAEALHIAVKGLRDRNVGDSECWIPFIHIGV